MVQQYIYDKPSFKPVTVPEPVHNLLSPNWAAKGDDKTEHQISAVNSLASYIVYR